MFALYSLALLLVLIIGAPYWLFRMATNGKYREGLAERLGRIPKRIHIDDKPVIWVHAVSVGEVLAASRMIDELTARLPDWRVVVSTTTRTGQKIARERFGDDRVFYFPLDFAFAVHAWLHVLQPRMVVLLETEFWPRMLAECRRAKIPVAVVNARISDRSWPRYLRLRFLWKHLLNSFTLVLAQSELDAERLETIGASNVRVGGNLKFGIRVTKSAPVTEALQRHLPTGVKIVVCGSTLSGEEEALLEALPPDIVIILAPRHPERFSAVEKLLSQRKAPYLLRSIWMESPAAITAGTVFLLDSIGELASVYSLADLAFVGGGLFTSGGHNPLEPAQFGVPVVMGSYYENFRGIVDKLMMVDAIEVVEITELQPALQRLLTDQNSACAMGERARKVFESEAGATETAVNSLLEIIGQHEARLSRPQTLLMPLVPIYAALLGAKNFAYDRRGIKPKHLAWPVISVGNLSVGGAGKTPVVIRLAQLLTEQGHLVDILSRGYGRTSQSVERIDSEGSAARFGDEPILIARNANVPVYVGANRYVAGGLAEREQPGPGIHLLDDGFQHRRLARDLDIVVLHRSDFEERLLPAGRLRESLIALKRASIVVLRDEDRHLEEDLRRRGIDAPVWIQRRRLAIPPIKKSIAFCGIARPEEFFAALRNNGIDPVWTVRFRDHHAYTDADIDGLLQLRGQRRAEAFITTEKDWVRLTPAQRACLAPLQAAKLEVLFENETAVAAQLDYMLVRK